MTFSEPTIRTQLTRYLQTLAGDAHTIADDDDLFAAGIVRSMHVLALINHLEDAYGIAVAQRDVFAGRLRSVSSLLALVLEGSAGRAA